MLPSLIFGRSGSTDGETGLFLLEGSLATFCLDSDEVRRIAAKREGFEINTAQVHRQDNGSTPGVANPDYFNKTEGYCQDCNDFEYLLRDAGGVTGFAARGESAFMNFDTRKYDNRKYLNEFVGLVPRTRAIKAILREDGCRTKRTMVFAAGVPQSQGGKTWVIAPCGFTWLGQKAPILVPASSFHFDELLDNPNRLWAVITDAVPMFSGHYQLQPGEQQPRILHTKLDESQMEKYMKTYIQAIVNGDGDINKGEQIIKYLQAAGKKSGNGIATKQEICFGLDDQIVDVNDNGMW